MPVRPGCSLLLAVILHLAGTASLAESYVNSTLDQPDIDLLDGICRTIANTCTLRAAIMQENNDGPGSYIFLPPGIYQLTRPPAGANGTDNGDLNFTESMNVVGYGAESTIVDGGGLDRVFTVAAGHSVTLWSLTVRNGATQGPGATQEGGGILVLGSAGLDNVIVRDNQAIFGGGVAARGPNFWMDDSTIRDNRAAVRGGGLLASGEVTIRRSTISGNAAASDHGGGIYLYSMANLRMEESTISSNRAGVDGGGIFASHQDVLNIYSSTIVFNQADANDDGTGDGGGIVNNVFGSNTVNVRNCLIAGNYIVNFFDWDDCVGTISSYGRNLFGDVAGCSVITGSGDWGLLNDLAWIGSLAKNGGVTQTHAIYPGSNAIDGGDPADGCGGPFGAFTVDQRRVPRVNGARCDVGAYEAGVLFADGFELNGLAPWPSWRP